MALDIELTRHRFTLDEYHRMAQVGILNEDDRVELIRGEIVQMTGPEDVALLIEVADSSLRYDRRLKASLYAEAGVQEYWIVDLEGGAVEVHRNPSGGGFRSVERVGPAATLSPLAFPDVQLAAASILG